MYIILLQHSTYAWHLGISDILCAHFCPALDIGIFNLILKFLLCNDALQNAVKTCTVLQCWSKSLRRLEFAHLIPILNKSCKIECFANKMHQIVQNMILSRDLELELSMFCEGQLSQVRILDFRDEEKYVKLCSCYISIYVYPSLNYKGC